MGKPKRIIEQHIQTLFELAEKKEAYEKRYIQLAQKYSTRYNVPIPKELKRSFCKECHSLFRNSSVRIRRNMRIITCAKCGAIKRIGFSKK